MVASRKRAMFGKVFTATAVSMVAGGAVDALTKPLDNASVPGMLLALAAFLGVAFLLSLVWYGALLPDGAKEASSRTGAGSAEPGAAPDPGRR